MKSCLPASQIRMSSRCLRQVRLSADRHHDPLLSTELTCQPPPLLLGQLLHLPARRLPSLLTPLLNLLALHSNLTPPHSVHANLVLDGLISDEILGTPPAGCDADELAEAVLAHFGSFFGEKGEQGRRWKVDAARCIREVGRGLLEGLEVCLLCPVHPPGISSRSIVCQASDKRGARWAGHGADVTMRC